MEETVQRAKEITISVNDNPVTFDTDLVTGLQIKSKAGVEPNSILYELRGDTKVPIGDKETIKIHENERFLDVPGGTVS